MALIIPKLLDAGADEEMVYALTLIVKAASDQIIDPEDRTHQSAFDQVVDNGKLYEEGAMKLLTDAVAILLKNQAVN